ncbi:hypothetical protein NQZ68_028565 [Dissostichus eleginoides]|nr:hypothetical protein NQZ68_028565 [Dissostichus eleginoides]
MGDGWCCEQGGLTKYMVAALWVYDIRFNSCSSQLICSQFLSSGETLRPAEEPETLRRDSQTCRGTRDTEEGLSDLQRNQRH